mgnify:CR=1 FL=1
MAQTQTILGTTVYGEASGNYDGSSQDWYHPESILGNFVWMRLHVTAFEGGTINSVTITY